jgi:isocitrate dehydrogenase
LVAQAVFEKHGELLKELKVNPNNGLGDLYDKIKGHPLQETIEKDIQVCTG